MNKPVHHLRIIGILEGISFLILLGVAMPLKYIWKEPMAVKIFGMAHGVLFLALLVALVRVIALAHWPVSRAGLVFLASLIPFGPFLIDKRMRQWEGQPRSTS